MEQLSGYLYRFTPRMILQRMHEGMTAITAITANLLAAYSTALFGSQ